MKQTEICYSRSQKINLGSYEQDAPMFSIKSIIDGECNEAEEYQRLQGIVDGQLNAYVAKVKGKEEDLSHLRIREKDGLKFPSVTTIMNPDPYTGDPLYGIRGTEEHRITNHFLQTKEWLEPSVDISPLKWSDMKHKEFFEKFGDRIEFVNLDPSCRIEIPVWNEEYMYSGEVDVVCRVDGKKTLCDIKTGGYKWEQLFAYAKCSNGGLEQVAIWDMKKCKLLVKQLTEVKYWEKFLMLRGAFKQRYGV